MRISDWSSDVCSSDLPDLPLDLRAADQDRPGASPELPRADVVGPVHLVAHGDRRDHLAGHRGGARHRGAPAATRRLRRAAAGHRKSVVSGTGVYVLVDLGGRWLIKKQKQSNNIMSTIHTN